MQVVLHPNIHPHTSYFTYDTPLQYEYVYQLVRDFPQYDFTLNGGITSYAQVQQALSNGVHGVMVGRNINERPWYWSQVDSRLYGVSYI